MLRIYFLLLAVFLALDFVASDPVTADIQKAPKLFYFPLKQDSKVGCTEAARNPYAHGLRIRAGFGKMLREDYEIIQELLQQDGGHFRLCDCRFKNSGNVNPMDDIECKDIDASVNLVFRMVQREQ